jgi:hypothetical protein
MANLQERCEEERTNFNNEKERHEDEVRNSKKGALAFDCRERSHDDK